MRYRFFILPLLICTTVLPALSAPPVRVVCSMLDMADFTRQIGGDRVKVHAVLNGKYDPHFFEPRPSEVMKLRKADMVVVAGMELDAFMQGLIDASRNPKIKFGSPGFVDPSKGVQALDIPTERITGAMGDVHPFGNPHFWFTPENVTIACTNIAEGLIRVSPIDATFFRMRLETYLQEVDQTFASLKSKLEPYRGTKVLQYHLSWDYFCETFGLQLAGSVEPKPGIAPSASHLNALVQRIREENISLILVEPFYPERPLRFLRSQSGVAALRVPLFLGGDKNTTSYLENLEFIVDSIIGGMES